MFHTDLSMAEKRLTNDELYQELLSNGLAAGPITDSTRHMHEKRLLRFKQTQKHINNDSGSNTIKRRSRGQSPRNNTNNTTNNKRRRNSTKSSSIANDIIPGLANFTNKIPVLGNITKQLSPRSNSLSSSPSSPPLFPSTSHSANDRRHSYRNNNDNIVPVSSLLEVTRSDLTPPCTGIPSLEYNHLAEEEEGVEEEEPGLFSGVIRMIGEGVKEGVKQIVNKVTGGVTGEEEIERKRKASWIDEDSDDDDYDYYEFNAKRLHISPPPSAPPMPIPPKPSAPPKPLAMPKPVFSPMPKLSGTPSKLNLAPPAKRIASNAPPNPIVVSPIVASPIVVQPNHTLAPPKGVSYDWELLPSDVTICRRPDGSQWRLGKGGFGEVYKGLKDGIDEVAVKVIHLSNPSSINQFKSEINLISKLRHKNILQFYGACVKPSSPLYMVTELMQNDLFNALRTDKRYTWTGCYGKSTLICITSGIHYLHSRRPPVVHRDIKSPNILLTDGIAKIADVGIAKTKMESDMTAQRGFTIAWAAPEVVYRKRATEKIDIWSLGIILWEIVTGKPPGPGQLVLPHTASTDLKLLYSNCTRDDYTLRPSAADVLVTLKNMDH